LVEWLTLCIDAECFIKPYSIYYQTLKSLYHFIENDPPKIQVLKCYIYLSLVNQGNENEFSSLNEKVNQCAGNLIPRLSFNKVMKAFNAGWENTVYFSLDTIPINKITINDVTAYLSSNMTDTYDDGIICRVDK
jgi:hypothetical protein